jgi:hypothetical protein
MVRTGITYTHVERAVFADSGAGHRGGGLDVFTKATLGRNFTGFLAILVLYTVK